MCIPYFMAINSLLYSLYFTKTTHVNLMVALEEKSVGFIFWEPSYLLQISWQSIEQLLQKKADRPIAITIVLKRIYLLPCIMQPAVAVALLLFR